METAAMPTALGTAVTFITEQMISVLGLVTAEPVLCLGIAIWVAGAGIGLFKRLV